MPVAIINGIRHYYRLEGNPAKPPLVLVHPIGADASLWDKVSPLLTDRFRVLRYDLRGHGGSETGVGDCSLALLASDLLALTETLGIGHFVVAGVSLGAMAAVHAAAIAPDRVTAVVACSVAARLNPPPGGWDGRAVQVLQQGTAGVAAGMVERMFSAPFTATHDPAIDTLRTVLERMDPQGYAAACAVLRDTDLATGASRVRAPVLVVTGEADPLVPPAVGQALAGLFARGRWMGLPCGHFPPVEDAASFSAALTEFASQALNA